MSNGVCSKKPHSIWPCESKVMPLWNSTFLDNDQSITCQPHMRNSCSWTFWKGESKIYNFHVGQNFIWSIFGHVILRRKPFHFWQFWITSHFLFLESFVLTLFSSMLMFEMSNETCLNMNEVFLITSHLQIHSWLCSWLSRSSDDLKMFWWNSSLYHLGFCFKMTS